jgi:hypothetical protein
MEPVIAKTTQIDLNTKVEAVSVLQSKFNMTLTGDDEDVGWDDDLEGWEDQDVDKVTG